MTRARNLQSMLVSSLMLAMLAGCGATSVTVMAPGYLEAHPDAQIPANTAKEWCGGLGMGVQMVKERPYFTAALELALPGVERGKQSLVIAGGVGESALRDDIDDPDPFEEEDDYPLQRGDYSESLRITWRRYMKQPTLDGATAFWEAGTSRGSLCTDAWYEEATNPEWPYNTYKKWDGDFADAMRLVFGAGVKWVGPHGLFYEASVRALTGVSSYCGVDVAGSLLIGGRFGRRPRAPRAGRWVAESSGPRMGLVVATGEAADQLEARDLDPVLSLLGWQFEMQHQGALDGPTGLVQFIPLVAGMEQELSLASLNILFGIRNVSDFEFAAGPYISGTGTGFTVAAGKTFRAGRMAMPVNLGYTSTKEGPRYSLTFGWNIGR